ncbi:MULTISPECIES: Tc toxin subunit A-related protein [Photorhabdus]|uniref:Insecticidal toxin complex protein tccb2 n=2 Tax=Photorhabdus asymbiotica TaxID=291112 RepID=C7BJ82_PHOAA|nr:neuraminidase-like domain-containing protein [Photorhabdus asymbiotica]RKS65953.1 DNA-binding transcriptional regulator YbjK [Photorhabdus asymbiotica]CAQ84150.1 insecticidal toxin complex protein tccb2 [Photorhabdus asymbiotica]
MSNSIEAKLQENLRDALVDYYLGQIVPHDTDFQSQSEKIKNVDDLYDFLLLDTQVSSKVKTARVAHVTQSVQQYINRIVLNLESGLSMTQEDADNWQEFANRYGYWSANQQLAIYPEVYVDPTLRLTKTEFFFQLESALNQGKLTDDVAQKAILGYLNNFEEVSNLEVIAGYEDGIDIANDKIYFIAKTRTQPYRYFWRIVDTKQRNGQTDELYPTAWSEWKLINVPLENARNGIIRPIILNSRLYISWFEVSEEKQDKDNSIKYRTKLNLAHLAFDGTWSTGTTVREDLLDHPMQELIAILDRTGDVERLALIAFVRLQGTDQGKPYDYDEVFAYVCDNLLMAATDLPKSNSSLSDLDSYGAALVWFYFREPLNGGPEEYKQLVLYPVNNNMQWPIAEPPTFEGSLGKIDDFKLDASYVEGSLNMYLTSTSTFQYDFSRSKNILYCIWLEDSHGERCWLNYKLLTPEDYDPKLSVTLNRCDRSDVTVVTGFSLPSETGTDVAGRIKTKLSIGKLVRDKIQIKQTKQTQYLQFPKEKQKKEQSGSWYSDKAIRLNTLFAKELISKANQKLDKVLSWETQNIHEEPITGSDSKPIDLKGANGIYFWELFFHMPFMVAWRFNVEQRYEEASRWIKFIFNPFESHDEPALTQDKPRYWNSRPIIDAPKELRSLIKPADPDAISASEPIHYRKAIFNFYVKNIIDQGDMEYRKLQPTARTLARLSYATANSLLGARPDLQLASFWQPIMLDDASYKKNSVIRGLEMISEPLPYVPVTHDKTISALDNDIFMKPINEELTALWDRIESRIYNLRHNLTLDGKEISMDLYDSKISPRGLMNQRYQRVVTARNASRMNFRVPNYRFEPMLARAKSGVETLIQFGSTLLSLLERKDNLSFESFQMIQNNDLYRFAVDLQQQDININQASLDALQVSKQSAQERYEHYKSLYDENISSTEQQVIELQSQASSALLASQVSRTAAAALDLVPNIYGLAVGGSRWGAALNAVAEIATLKYQSDNTKAESLSVSESYRRRRQEWELQYKQAEWEVKSIEQQIDIQQLQVSAARKRLAQVEAQQQQSQALLAYFSSRFTNESLYTWMISQISSLYLQAYDAVSSLCLSAQASLQYELGLDEQNFVDGGSWNDFYQGLLVGENLKLALQRMERVYVEQNSRRLEIIKTISLKSLLGEEWETKLQTLKSHNPITFNLDELKQFGGDYPGLFNRRIKSVSVTLPMLIGPYEDICAKLSLSGVSSYTTKADLKTVEKMLKEGVRAETPYTVRSIQPNQQIVLSTGINDSGMFTLNFDDERFLPFEGVGVGSSWNFQFTNTSQDLESLTDVILHIRYTAKEGSASFGMAVKELLRKENLDA